MRKVKLTGLTVLLGLIVVASSAAVSAGRPASSSGGHIAFHISSGSYDLYEIRSDGTGLRQLTRTPHIIEEYATWSPDGRRVAYSRHGILGTPGYLYAMNADGSGGRRLFTVPRGDWAYPAWSPAGRQIAFSEYSGPGIYVVGTDGRGFHKIPGTREGDAAPSWSPDGKQLVFNSPAGIEVIGIDGNGRHQLTADGIGPVWSPDGRHIAFVNQSPTGDQIWVMNADGSQAQRLTGPHAPAPNGGFADDREPAWSPDSTQIAFTRTIFGRNANYDPLFVMSADGHGQHRVGRIQIDVAGPAWQP